MTFADIRTAVGRKCSLVDGNGAFVDSLVSEGDVLGLANQRWKELHVKYSDKFPDGIALEVLRDLVDGQEDYDLKEIGLNDFLLPYVGIKYSSSDTYFTKVRRRRYVKLNNPDTDTSRYSKTTPFYMEVPTREDVVGGSSQQFITASIRLRPVPDANVTDGLLLKIIEMPEPMVLDTDAPYTLPEAAHSLITDYVVADVWEIKRDWANSNEALNRAIMNEKSFFANYQPTTADENVRYDVGKKWNPYDGR